MVTHTRPCRESPARGWEGALCPRGRPHPTSLWGCGLLGFRVRALIGVTGQGPVSSAVPCASPFPAGLLGGLRVSSGHVAASSSRARAPTCPLGGPVGRVQPPGRAVSTRKQAPPLLPREPQGRGPRQAAGGPSLSRRDEWRPRGKPRGSPREAPGKPPGNPPGKPGLGTAAAGRQRRWEGAAPGRQRFWPSVPAWPAAGRCVGAADISAAASPAAGRPSSGTAGTWLPAVSGARGRAWRRHSTGARGAGGERGRGGTPGVGGSVPQKRPGD